MANNFDEVVIFGKKTYSDLLKNIYDNQNKTEKQIMDMIMALKPFINSPGEAVMVVPLIAQYMEIKVKNDEHLVKIAAIIQRSLGSGSSKGNESDSYALTEEERSALLLEIKNVGESQAQISESVDQKLIK